MLKLSPRHNEATWLDLLPGVRVQMKPITVAMMMVARRAGFAALDRPKLADGEEATPLTENQQIALSVGIVSSLVHQGIAGWEGVGDAEGNPMPVTPGAIDQLLDVVPAFDAFDRLYYTPAVVMAAEKNG